MVPKKIVCLGDSITESKSVGVLDGWPVRLQLHLTSSGPWHIYNRGISGQTTRDALERLEKDVLSLLPGWVLIEFGINDSSFRPSQKIPRVSREDFALCLNEIVRQIQVARGEPILMINHPLGTPDPRQPNGKSRGANLRDYHEMTRRIAKTRGCPIVDLHRRLTQQGLSKWRAKGLRKDGVHLTALGHRMYAEAMMQELTPLLKKENTPLKPKRYAFVGTGNRVRMFLDPAASKYRDQAQVVALCDLSQTRADWHRDRLQKKFNLPPPPFYRAEQFSMMLQETRPDVVVVTTMDSTHDEFIVAALHAGCDVVTEKPMTVDAPKCRRILQAVQETGRHVRVTFNYRWGAGATEVKKFLSGGTMGRVRLVHLEYLLNTRHGADYFRRWHSQKECSGGLLVHKSTHHFDLVNWWIDSIPNEVSAFGNLAFYGEANALQRGDQKWTGFSRYTGRENGQDPFAYRLDDPKLTDPEMEQGIYWKAEKETGYLRDQNVFRPGITIEDAMSVLVRYRDDTLLNYSLNAFSPYEGYTATFTCDRGRVEYREFHGAHIIQGAGSKSLVDEHGSWKAELKVFPHFQDPYEVQIPFSEGGHGGGDPLLQEQIFSLSPPADPWDRSAGHEQGAASILVGVAANESIRTHAPVRIGQLVELRPKALRLTELV